MQRPSSRCVKTLVLQPIAKMWWVGLRLAWSGRSGKSDQTLFFPFLTPHSSSTGLRECKSGRRKGWCERKEVVGGSLLVWPGLACSGLDSADQTRLDQTPPSFLPTYPFRFPFSPFLFIWSSRMKEGGKERMAWKARGGVWVCVGLVWPSLAWFRLVWPGLAWPGLVWKVQIRPDQARPSFSLSSLPFVFENAGAGE